MTIITQIIMENKCPLELINKANFRKKQISLKGIIKILIFITKITILFTFLLTIIQVTIAR